MLISGLTKNGNKEMPCPWLDGIKPKIKPDLLLVLGNENLKNGKKLSRVLDLYTIRMEMVTILLLGKNLLHNCFGKNKKPGDYVGVTYFASKWAEYNWWTRSYFHGSRQVSEAIEALRDEGSVFIYKPDDLDQVKLFKRALPGRVKVYV